MYSLCVLHVRRLCMAFGSQLQQKRQQDTFGTFGRVLQKGARAKAFYNLIGSLLPAILARKVCAILLKSLKVKQFSFARMPEWY